MSASSANHSLRKLTPEYASGLGLELSKEPDMITLDNDDPCVKMPGCGHALASASCTQLTRSVVDGGGYEVRCPVVINDKGKTKEESRCNALWPYSIIRAVGMFTNEEKKFFEERLSHHAAVKQLNIRECPQCHNEIFREEKLSGQIRLLCGACYYQQNHRKTEICYTCGLLWKNKDSRTDCGNPSCRWEAEVKTAETTLANAKKKSIDFGIHGIPSIRACPRAECQRKIGIVMIEHVSNCKHMTCKECKYRFCLVCLSVEHPKGGCFPAHCKGAYDMCTTLAPLQKASDFARPEAT